MPQPMLTQKQAIPYVLEARDLAASASAHLAQMEVSARLLCEAMRANRASGAVLNTEPQQGRLWAQFDTFLAVYGRLSQLFFPSSKQTFAINRGESLRTAFVVDASSLLHDRALRDSWTHADERLDAVVQADRALANQRFTLSEECSGAVAASALRVIEVDSLRVHFFDRAGVLLYRDLRPLAGQLTQILAEVPAALGRLEVPEDWLLASTLRADAVDQSS